MTDYQPLDSGSRSNAGARVLGDGEGIQPATRRHHGQQDHAPAWTPMFARFPAVVVDSGSVLGHTGIVAREYGIPCVVGVKTATTQIRDGMMVTVNGNQGIVRIGGPRH